MTDSSVVEDPEVALAVHPMPARPTTASAVYYCFPQPGALQSSMTPLGGGYTALSQELPCTGPAVR